MEQTSTPIDQSIEQVASTATPVRQMRPRLEALDALRGFAACMVAFLHHYVGTVINPGTYALDGLDFPLFGHGVLISWLVVNSRLAVQFFWVLSGFVFAYVYRKSIAKNKVSPGKFFVWRFSRLYPLYLLCTLLIVMVSIVTGKAASMGYTLFGVLKNTTLLSSVFEYGVNPIVGSAWSLCAEIVAYFVFFVVTKKFNGKLAVYLIPVIASVFVLQIGWKFPIFNPWVAQCVLAFFVGCFTCKLFDLLRKTPKTKVVLGLFGVALALASPILFATKPAVLGKVTNTCIVFIFPLLILGVLNLRPLSRILSLGIFRWLGDISFSIYFIHIVVLRTMRFTGLTEALENPSSVTLWLTYIAVVLALSTLSHYCFEIPVQNKIRTAYKNYRKQQRAEKEAEHASSPDLLPLDNQLLPVVAAADEQPATAVEQPTS